jgi:hypothetical protein
MHTTKNKVIRCDLSAAVSLEPLSNHISTAIQNIESLLISGQLIINGSSFEPLLIISSSAAV